LKTKIQKILKKLTHFTFRCIGIFAITFVALSFTDIPYYAYFNLGLTEITDTKNIKNIVVLGGDGMPSPSGLIRSYFGIQVAKENPESEIFIALPRNEDGSVRQLEMLAKEFTDKGILRSRIHFEPEGYNTFTQANNLGKLIKNKSDKTIIVTSPEHMYRSIQCFKKIGFKKLNSLPTFEIPSDETTLEKKDKKGKKESENLSLRYNMWSYMIYEIKVMREYIAITFYWFKGWI
jgi:uncharacterized SAM-binding protein YcdF (DUF218 family)